MNIIHQKPWKIAEYLVTPEEVFLNRRKVLGGLGAGTLTLAWVECPRRPELRKIQVAGFIR